MHAHITYVRAYISAPSSCASRSRLAATILARLYILAGPSTREFPQLDPFQPRLNVSDIDLMVTARGMGTSSLISELCRAMGIPIPVRENIRLISDSGQAVSVATPTDTRISDLLNMQASALAERDRPFVAVIDGLDEAVSPHHAAMVIARLARNSETAPIRLLVSTRRQLLTDLPDAIVIDLDDASYQNGEDILIYARQRLRAPDSSYRDQPEAVIDQVAEAVAASSGGNFIVASYAVEAIAEARVSDVDEIDKLTPESIADFITATLASLGADEQEATDLLRTLAHGPSEGYTLDEWAVAASRRGPVPYLRQDI